MTLEDLIRWIEEDDDYVSLGQVETEAEEATGTLDDAAIAMICAEVERGLRLGKIRVGSVGGATFDPYDESVVDLLRRVRDALVHDAREPDYHDIWFDIVRDGGG